MAVKTPGSLAGLQIVKETNYGVTPTSSFIYGGRMRTLEMTHDPHPEEMESDKSRERGDVIFTAEDFGFSAELSIFREGSVYKWTELFELTLGSLNGPTDDIPSFSTVLQVAKDQYFLAKGCKMNSLELSASKVGSQMYANIDVISMLITNAKGTLGELGTLGTPAVKPSEPPITYARYPTCNLPNMATIPARSWNLKINNNLERKEGFVDQKALTAGVGSIPGEAISIELTMDILSTSSFWDNLKLNLTKGFNVTLYVHNRPVELIDCYLPSNDLPSRSHTPYDETITIRARSIKVGSAV